MAFVFVAVNTNAQEQADFISPLNIPLQLSGNYGELRTNHFHSGVDIRVGGVVGQPVKAMADGYVNRVFVSPYGFGKAVYIAHPNGYTTVYCHLDRFNETIGNYALTQQYSRKSFNLDLYPAEGALKVKQGDIIGYAGNSGSSAGAHLHLDIRTTSNSVPVNVLARNFIKVTDNIAPVVVNIYRIEVDTLCGVPRHRVTATYTTKATSTNNYTINEVERVNIRRPSYFAIEVRGRKNDNSFNMGAYKVEQKVDSKLNFGFTIDNISYANMRYSNATGYYPLARIKSNSVYALTRLPGNKLPIYHGLVNDGILTCENGQTKNVSIDVIDDCGNKSTLSFDIYGYAYSEAERAKQEQDNKAYLETNYGTLEPYVAKYNAAFSCEKEGVRVSIPAGVLYKSMLVNVQSSAKDDRSLAPYYTVGNTDEPLHKAITISMDCSALEHYGNKLRAASVTSKGALASAGGKINGSRLEFTTTSFGKFTIVADTTAPRITPRWTNGASLASSKSFAFTISDDFSGVATIKATIDGKWAMFDYDAKNSVITHVFDSNRFEYNGTKHTVEVEVVDGCGNTKKYSGSFIR